MSKEKRTLNTNEWSDLQEQGWGAMKALLDEHMPVEEPSKRRVIPIYFRWMAAAVVLLMVGITGWDYFFVHRDTSARNNLSNTTAQQSNYNKTITPAQRQPTIASSVVSTNNLNKNQRSAHSPSVDIITPNNTSSSTAQLSHSHKTNITLQDSQFVAKARTTTISLSKDKSAVGLSLGSESSLASVLSPTSNKGNRKESIGLSNKQDTSNSKVSKLLVKNSQIRVQAAGVKQSMTNKTQSKDTLLAAKRRNIVESNGRDIGFANDVMLQEESKNTTGKNVRNNGVLVANSTKQHEKTTFKWSDPITKKMDSGKHVYTFDEHNTKKKDSLSLAFFNIDKDGLTPLQRKKMEEYKKMVEEKSTLAGNGKILDLAVHLNRNLSKSISTGNSMYDLPIYPTVTATIKVSQKMGITAGITANAPGESFTPSTSMTSMAMDARSSAIQDVTSRGNVVTLFDTRSVESFAAVSSSSAVTLRQAFYWQVPISIDYWPAKHFKVSAGSNLAFAQKMLVENGTDGNNGLQLINYSEYQSQTTNGGNNVRMFDPRMNLGLQYQLHRSLIGVHFTRSMLSSSRYVDGVNKDFYNQIINVSFGYNLFK